MDPKATLETIRKLSSKLLLQCDRDVDVDLSDVAELSQAAIDLDNWITSGGFLPDQWRK